MFGISRRVKTLIFILLALVSLFYLSHRARVSPTPNFFERGSLRLISPVSLGLGRGWASFKDFYHRYLHLTRVQEENFVLRKDLEHLNLRLSWLEEENRHLKKSLQPFQEWGLSPREVISARVVGQDPHFRFRSIVIDRGSADGLRPDQAVLAEGALVGRVLEVGSRQARVLLITDLKSAVDVRVEGSRARGTLMGQRRELGLQREHWLTQAEYLSAKEEVRVGERLLTSGLDGIFPPGIPVGEVLSVEKDAGGLFQRAQVRPQAEPAKLEEVVVLIH